MSFRKIGKKPISKKTTQEDESPSLQEVLRDSARERERAEERARERERERERERVYHIISGVSTDVVHP